MPYSLDHLTVETVKWPGGWAFTFLSGEVSVPVHGQVEVIVYPRADQNIEDFAVLRDGELRFEKLMANLPNSLSSSTGKIGGALSAYYPDSASLTPTMLLKGLNLRYAKISLDREDELIFEANKHFHGLVLCVFLDCEGRVAKVSLDG